MDLDTLHDFEGLDIEHVGYLAHITTSSNYADIDIAFVRLPSHPQTANSRIRTLRLRACLHAYTNSPEKHCDITGVYQLQVRDTLILLLALSLLHGVCSTGIWSFL